jgi:hypothetical protein
VRVYVRPIGSRHPGKPWGSDGSDKNERRDGAEKEAVDSDSVAESVGEGDRLYGARFWFPNSKTAELRLVYHFRRSLQPLIIYIGTNKVDVRLRGNVD